MPSIMVYTAENDPLNQNLEKLVQEITEAVSTEGTGKNRSSIIAIHRVETDTSDEKLQEEKKNHPKLSLREAEVLQCLANGLSPEQSAIELGIKVRTIRKYLDILRMKFNTTSRDQLMARAGYLGLCDPYKQVEK